METVYHAAGGMAGLQRLAAAWHQRVLADDVVAHAFHNGARPDHVERLAAYWAEALGGPPLYTGEYADHTYVLWLHSGQGEHSGMDERAIACFDAALRDIELDPAQGVGRVLSDYFAWATRVELARYPASADGVPAELALPKWSWDGLAG